MNLSIDLHLRRGEFCLDMKARLASKVVGLFGPSGAGKTTILNCLLGLDQPDTGRIELDGTLLYERTTCRPRRNVPVHKRRIGCVFQDRRLLPHLHVRGNLRYAEKRTPRRHRRFDFSDIVALLEIRPLLDRSIACLSGGQKQRVAIARALLASPRLLLLDEPLTGLDDPLRVKTLTLLRRVAERLDVGLLIVSHRLDEILALTDKLLLLRDGRLVDHGHYSDLVHRRDALELLGSDALTNVLELTVHKHCEEEGVTRFGPAEPCTDTIHKTLHGPLCPDLAIGQRIMASLKPDDIALATSPTECISMRNQVRGQVIRLARMDGRVLCLVDAGYPLLVEVTDASGDELQLRRGQVVWCLFKARALRCLSAGLGLTAHATPQEPARTACCQCLA